MVIVLISPFSITNISTKTINPYLQFHRSFWSTRHIVWRDVKLIRRPITMNINWFMVNFQFLQGKCDKIIDRHLFIDHNYQWRIFASTRFIILYILYFRFTFIIVAFSFIHLNFSWYILLNMHDAFLDSFLQADKQILPHLIFIAKKKKKKRS